MKGFLNISWWFIIPSKKRVVLGNRRPYYQDCLPAYCPIISVCVLLGGIFFSGTLEVQAQKIARVSQLPPFLLAPLSAISLLNTAG